MMLYYLATPYSNNPKGHDAAFNDAAELAARLMAKGYDVISPIVHGHPIAERNPDLGRDYERWWKINYALMSMCDCLLVARFRGWKQSKGVKAEIAYFVKHRKLIYYIDPVTLAAD